ncbi:MAG: hypothetical protein GKR89_35345 [Candidatus Latescibacteria bacterium]|nr:hypothetical protein [Candidatus Latescibacterota bacterium]
MNSREELRRELFQSLEAEEFPQAPPLNLNVLWKRTFLEYEEWKIEYDVETVATMGKYWPNTTRRWSGRSRVMNSSVESPSCPRYGEWTKWDGS